MGYKINPALLDKIRENENLSSDEKLAHHLGISLGTIRNIRAGEKPSWQTAVQVMEAADVTDIRCAVLHVA